MDSETFSLMALAYYRYCQRAAFSGFQPIKFSTYSKLYINGLDMVDQPRGD